MSRTPLQVQTLGAPTAPWAGTQVKFSAVDGVNANVFPNTGREQVILRVGSGGTCSVSFPSLVDQFGRLAPTTPVVITPGDTQIFGPFTPPAYWGDTANVFVDGTNVSGSVGIAVFRTS